MALTALGGMVPILGVGMTARLGSPSIATFGGTTLDATSEACIMVGQLYWMDGSSHTVNTTGSSSLQWRSGTSTFSNAGTTVKVGLAAVDSASGPPVRAANVSDVITFDVSASFTGGGGGITSAAWQTSVPTTGTRTIAHADLIAFAVQMTARGGADSVIVQAETTLSNVIRPTVTDFTGGSYSNSTRLPNVVAVASDGTLGFFWGGYVASIGAAAQSWNNTSSIKEYGNVMRLPVPATAYGIVVGNNFAGDCDLVLYSDPFGTPSAQRTISVDLNQIGQSAAASEGRFLFSSPYDLAANTDYAVTAKPTTGTNIQMNYKIFNASTHQAGETLGTNCYAINRDSGAFAAQNANKDRYTIGLLIGAFDAGGTAGRAVQINNDSLVS